MGLFSPIAALSGHEIAGVFRIYCLETGLVRLRIVENAPASPTKSNEMELGSGTLAQTPTKSTLQLQKSEP